MKYDAKAIGSGSEAAQSELQNKWHKVLVCITFVIHVVLTRMVQQMTLEEAQTLTVKILAQVMEERHVNENNVQLAQVRLLSINRYGFG